MAKINPHQYNTYIVTNPGKTALYTGVTNNLAARLLQHWNNRGKNETYAGRYYCYNLIYYEDFQYIDQAIAREKEIKGWKRQRKIDLINTMNSPWTFLNATICDGWPPKETP
jgi:putative endonuclease